MSQFRDFRDLVSHVSQQITSYDTRLLVFREDLPDRLEEEKPLIVLKYMINEQKISENKLKEFETALKGICRKDLAECVRKFSKRKKPTPVEERNQTSEIEKLGLGVTKLQAHLSHVHVRQYLLAMEQNGTFPPQALAELREAEQNCAEACRRLHRVAKMCAASHPDECVGSDDECSSLSSTLSNRDEQSLLQDLAKTAETARLPIPETNDCINRAQHGGAIQSPPQSPVKGVKGPATAPKPSKKPNLKPRSHLPTAVSPYPATRVALPILSKDALVTGSSRLRSHQDHTDNGGTGSDSGFSDAKEFLKVSMSESPCVAFDEDRVDAGSLEDEEDLYASTTIAYYKSLRPTPMQTEYTRLQQMHCLGEKVLASSEHIYEEPPRESDGDSDDGLYEPLTH